MKSNKKDMGICEVCGSQFHKHGLGPHQKACLRLKNNWTVEQTNRAYKDRIGTWGETSRKRYKRRELNDYWKKFQTQRRVDIIKKYGGKCAHCGIDDIRVLQVDHVYSDGRQERKKIAPTVLQRILREKKRMSKYQILCANCNWIKRLEIDSKIGGDERDYRERKEDRNRRNPRSAATPRRTS